MKTISIKGREYVPVVERVKEFHNLYPKGWIETQFPPLEASEMATRVVIRATVYLGDGRHFSGHSQAEWDKGMMGAVALEVAETSAIGRALGFANIGLLDGIASADEVRKNKHGLEASGGLKTQKNPRSPVEIDEAPDFNDNNFNL